MVHFVSVYWPLLAVVAETIGGWRLLFPVGMNPHIEAAIGELAQWDEGVVEVVIPARNEAVSLPYLLASLASQEGVRFRTTVIDDRSSDATIQVAGSFGCRVLRVQERLGNNPKAAALAAWTPLASTRIVIFLDADVKLVDSRALSRLVAEAGLHPKDLISVQPFHRMVRAYEQAAFFPNLIAVIASGAFLPTRRSQSRAAFGPVLCCWVERYREIGGHRAVTDAILDDQALGARFRDAGGSVLLMAGRGWIEFRMYPNGFASLLEGFRKNLVTGAFSVRGVGALVATFIVVAELAAAVALARSGWSRLPAASAVLGIVCLATTLTARRIGSFRWYSVVAQLAYLVIFLWLVASSGVDVLRGQTHWRGQTMRMRR